MRRLGMNLWGSLALALMIVPLHALALHPEDVFLDELFAVVEPPTDDDASTDQECEDARERLANDEAALDGLRSALNAASVALDVARAARDAAQVARDIACNGFINIGCEAAEAALRSAQSQFNTANRAYQAAKKALQKGESLVDKLRRLVAEKCGDGEENPTGPRPRPDFN